MAVSHIAYNRFGKVLYQGPCSWKEKQCFFLDVIRKAPYDKTENITESLNESLVIHGSSPKGCGRARRGKHKSAQVQNSFFIRNGLNQGEIFVFKGPY